MKIGGRLCKRSCVGKMGNSERLSGNCTGLSADCNWSSSVRGADITTARAGIPEPRAAAGADRLRSPAACSPNFLSYFVGREKNVRGDPLRTQTPNLRPVHTREPHTPPPRSLRPWPDRPRSHGWSARLSTLGGMVARGGVKDGLEGPFGAA